MHGVFLQDLAMVMIVAAVAAIIFRRFGQPVVLGYILAGLVIGPHTPIIPLSVQDQHTVELLAELGVILLMFGLGLHFSLRQLASVGATAFIAATMEIALMLAIGYGIGRLFGWSSMDSIFLGAILSISSTTIIVKALEELGLIKARFAELIFGILIVEDILAIAMIALLSGLATSGSLEAGEVALTLGQIALFLAAVLVVGLLAVPPLVRYVDRHYGIEILLITTLGLCFGVSLLALELGYSVALGAFLIGAVIAETREHGKIEGLVAPVRDMFSAVFFVAVGMLIDPPMLIEYALPIAVITVAVVLGKVVTCALGTFLAGHDPRTSAKVGMGLAQIGEFSFIIASLGLTLGVTSGFIYPIAVMVSAITTLLTPYLIRSSDLLVDRLSKVTPPFVVNYIQLYSGWVAQLRGGGGHSGEVRRLMRRLTLQVGLNLLLVAVVFAAASLALPWVGSWWPDLPPWVGGPEAVGWLAAMVLSLPLLIVSLRKIRAIASIAAEASVTQHAAGKQTQAVRSVIAGTIRLVGWTVILLHLAGMTLVIQPTWPALAIAAAVATAIAVWHRRSLDRVYSKAQIALREVLSQPPEPPPPPAPRVLPTVLHDAELEMVTIPPDAPAAGKLLRELELRRQTGASAVGIERESMSLPNPGPDEELQPGDQVLLLGSRSQLDAARQLLLVEVT